MAQLRRAAADASWRVRWSVATKFFEVGKAIAGAILVKGTFG